MMALSMKSKKSWTSPSRRCTSAPTGPAPRNERSTRQALPVALEEWSDNLVDMATGALLAPSRRHAHQAPT